MKSLQKPEEELRFTRAAQALPFWLAAAVLLGASVTLMACSFYRGINPDLPHPLWAILPLSAAGLSARFAFRLTRHAYLILTPLGVEIFPLWKPERGMRLVYWQEIAEVEAVEDRRLILHFNAEHTGGVHLSLRPIPKSGRKLLLLAMTERTADKK